jgi:hypothetical protein
MIKQETFEVKQALQLENSFGVLKHEDQVTLEVTVGIKSDDYGWFELYDIESGGEEWYAEGGLWIENKVITQYDGVFSLPPAIINKLKEWGYDTSEIEC